MPYGDPRGVEQPKQQQGSSPTNNMRTLGKALVNTKLLAGRRLSIRQRRMRGKSTNYQVKDMQSMLIAQFCLTHIGHENGESHRNLFVNEHTCIPLQEVHRGVFQTIGQDFEGQGLEKINRPLLRPAKYTIRIMILK